MADKRINKLDSLSQQDDSSDFVSRDLDTSLQATLFAQYDDYFSFCLDCFGFYKVIAMTKRGSFCGFCDRFA